MAAGIFRRRFTADVGRPQLTHTAASEEAHELTRRSVSEGLICGLLRLGEGEVLSALLFLFGYNEMQ